MKNPSEAEVEDYFRREVLKAGGTAHPWKNLKGAPDRLVIFQGRVFFVEMKTKNGRLAPWQVRFLKKLVAMDMVCYVLWTKEQVDEWVTEVRTSPISEPSTGRYGDPTAWRARRLRIRENCSCVNSNTESAPTRGFLRGSGRSPFESMQAHMAAGNKQVETFKELKMLPSGRKSKRT